MLKRDISFTDFDGNEQTETHYFNLSKIEMMEKEVGGEGGSFAAWVQRVVDANDQKALIEQFKMIVLDAYGERSEDGRAFLKDDDKRAYFERTAAFEALFLELAMDDGAAVEFVLGIVPADMRDEAASKMVVPKTTPPPPAVS